MSLPAYREDLVYRTNEKVRATYAEANREPDEQYPIWCARTMYDYCAGMPWDASEAKHLAECRRVLGLVTAPTVPVRSGLVRLDGRGMVDDGGPWLALGASYFPLLWMVQNDPTRARQNLAWLKDRGVDFVRVFADVYGPTWEDRAMPMTDPNWPAVADAAIRLCHELGLRIGWTLFAGPLMDRPADWYQHATDTYLAAIAPHLDAVQYSEVRNETVGCDDETARACARRLADALPATPVAVCGLPETELPALYRASGATVATVHWDRQPTERGWRPVRQPWGYYDLAGMPAAHINNEPIGIDSSVASESDPVRLMGAAVTAWLTGECAYVLHHGAGIRAGGAADVAKDRQVNVWDQPTLGDALRLIARARDILPPDLPNWNRQGHAWPTHPLSIQSAVGDACEAPGGTGCNRCYAATRGDRAVVGVMGIRQYFTATSKAGWFTVHRPDQAPSGPLPIIHLTELVSPVAILVR